MSGPPGTAQTSSSSQRCDPAGTENPGGTTTGRNALTGHRQDCLAGRSPDEPQFNVRPNASRPGLVLIAVGSGTDVYSITPPVAEALADELLAAATAARQAGGVR